MGSFLFFQSFLRFKCKLRNEQIEKYLPDIFPLVNILLGFW